jgi:hypothetical protein
MSDIIGFVFGALCGLTLGIIIMGECLKPSNNPENPKVVNPAENTVFVSCQPKDSLDIPNPLQGGAGISKLSEKEPLKIAKM